MFKLPARPTPRADSSELADYMELLCWIRGRVSRREMMSCLGRMDDNLDQDGEGYEGCEDADEGNGTLVDEALAEIEDRQSACNGGYPFSLDDTGTVLKALPSDDQSDSAMIYFYLLAATRLNMREDKIQGEIDGALTMESVSAHALRAYLGSRSKAEVFGTSAGGSFRDRIDRLCKSLNEPTSYSNVDGDEVAVHAQDDKLDVVAWIPFASSSPGQLIVFAQSKTGTSWRDRTSELQPDVFQDKWLTKHFLVPPVRAFCVAESVIGPKWNSTCLETGLLFDRCRLVDCCAPLDRDTGKKISVWLSAAKNTIADYLHE